MLENSLTQKEIDERMAVLFRFKKLLEQQREKFREYLSVLEKQQTAINDGNTDVLAAHTELEEQIVSNLNTLKKVADPMAHLYRLSKQNAAADQMSGGNGIQANKTEADADILHLQDDIAQLQEQIVKQNKKNRELLKVQMESIREKIAQAGNPASNPFKHNRSVYAADSSTAHIIDIQL
ncbi:MAG: flagellar protein FlgN [Bacteroides sp.]|nr:flagellar protein FlgN [Prevotella sp.]MCM1407586.1 flagellar protein FlgN [Treponema brennaborense]MCM1469264.1 flagellar protein FlgN [Bacteroides sp.]